ncbi:MAG: Fic family protein [Bdellovibrionales bacterium]|nr:Fic family protein [Bdellovibrionales bacterium]
MYKNWHPELITPTIPPEGNPKLEDLAFDLSTRASEFAGKLNPVVQAEIGELVRSMNCYYSNLIEGHNTHPIDIERALNDDYSKDKTKRNLQLEARAHIETQKKIDEGALEEPIYSTQFIKSVHKEFLFKLPQEMLLVKNPDTGQEKLVCPGEFRDGDVRVGEHIAPPSEKLAKFLSFYEEQYEERNLSKIRKIIAIPAAHHRLLWIHPFYDGNGRVARLVDHAAFRKLEIGNSLWTASRGLARRSDDYKKLLMGADQQRKGDLDGRGNLSLGALIEFCVFYLEVCWDQVDDMRTMLEPDLLLNRIENYVREKLQQEKLPRGSFEVLQYALLRGEFERGKVTEITGYKTRQARTVLTELLRLKLLVSDSPKGKVRLGFPIEAAGVWFPKLFPII